MQDFSLASSKSGNFELKIQNYIFNTSELGVNMESILFSLKIEILYLNNIDFNALNSKKHVIPILMSNMRNIVFRKETFVIKWRHFLKLISPASNKSNLYV